MDCCICVRVGLSVLILTAIVQATSSQPCTNLIVFNGDEKITVNCTEYPTANCSNGPSHESFPPYLSAGASVAQPRDFQVTQYRGNFPYNNNVFEVSGLNYEWKVPLDGISRQHIKGFYLRMEPVGSGSVLCRLFDLRNFDMSTSAAYSFKFSLFPFFNGDTSMYIVDLFSLPPPSSQEYEQGLYERYIVSIPPRRNLNMTKPVDPAKWTTWVVVQPYPTVSKIEVKFGFPVKGSLADTANFTKYVIQLVTGDRVVARFDYIRTMYSGNVAEHNFTDVPSGTYRVQVQPESVYTDPNKCECWIENTDFPGSKVCDNCVITETKPFNFTSITTTPTPTTATTTTKTPVSTAPPKGTDASKTSAQPSTLAPGASTNPHTSSADTSKILIAVFVSLLLVAIVVIVVVVCCWRYRVRQKGKDGAVDNNDNNVKQGRSFFTKIDMLVPGMTKELKVPQLSRKTVVLLASEDHKYFSQALHHFSTFLSLHCQCDVMFASQQLSDVRKTANTYCWLSGKIDQADYVIIVTSEAACRLYQAFQNGQVYKEADLGPEGDLFTPGLKHICGKIARGEDVSKVMMVGFEHTSSKHRLPISALPPSFYPLPSRLKSCLFHIHGLDDKTMNLSKVNLPLQGNVAELEGGKEWLAAVSKSLEFEREHPGWFGEKFGRPVDVSDKDKPSYDTQVSGLSEESGFFEGRNSGLLPRRLSSVSTHAEEQHNAREPDGVENPSFVFSKSDFFAPSEFGGQSAYTVPFSTITAADRPPEVDQGSTISDEFRMMNERYEQDRMQELCQQQGPERIPQEERSAISDQTGYPQAYQNLAYPHHDAYYVEIQRCESEGDVDCISVSSAQSV